MDLRSDVSKSLRVAEKLKVNVLPLKHEIVGHYYYLKNELKESAAKFMKKNSSFKDVKKNLLSDIVAVWKKRSSTNQHSKSGDKAQGSNRQVPCSQKE